MNKAPQNEALQGLFYSLLLQKNLFYRIGTFFIKKTPKPHENERVKNEHFKDLKSFCTSL